MLREREVASGRKERCDTSQNAQNASDTEYPLLASGRNACRSDAGSAFAHIVAYVLAA